MRMKAKALSALQAETRIFRPLVPRTRKPLIRFEIAPWLRLPLGAAAEAKDELTI
jgi:hypothetical protein